MRQVGKLAVIQRFFHVCETRVLSETGGTGMTRHQPLLPRRRVKTNLHSFIRTHLTTSPPNNSSSLTNVTPIITQYQ